MYNKSLLVYSKDYNIEYFLQEDVCRFCWKRNAVQELMAKTYENECESKSSILDQIRDCLDINLAHDCYPNKVCNACYDEIKRFYYFKNFCQETDKRLKEILQTNSTEIKKDSIQSELPIKAEKHVSTHIEDDNFDGLLETFHHSDSSENEKKQKKVKLKQTYIPKRSPTYCNICRLDLKTLEHLTQHNSVSHGIEGNFYKCFGCEKRFKSRKTRIGHEINFCKGLKDGYRCMVCERCLPKRRMYEAHMRDHRDNVAIELPDKLFKCKQCCISFKTREGLKEHVSKHGNEKKNYVCESCGRVFTRQDYLHKHKLTHTGTKQHVCPHCGFRSTQRSSLTVHIRKHTGERPYSCDMCPQRCISSSNLRAHRRRHLGLKKFECTICDKKFGYKVSLDEHIESSHHRSQTHACRHCGATYSRKRGLRRHLLAKHETHKDENGVCDVFTG
ncbi:hypothetical protein MSG28_014645 [Choristoneura fumiferana]|uniref:Uncharacterized protein n=1 Tax=Choristoneura fumiferana TaxID=7141 RepID=A0ACC0JS34_CHOFU|nr:hypothetical protein MSG28_014645 [Choristoneura fumiferana]